MVQKSRSHTQDQNNKSKHIHTENPHHQEHINPVPNYNKDLTQLSLSFASPLSFLWGGIREWLLALLQFMRN